jgi:hypothetical protein
LGNVFELQMIKFAGGTVTTELSARYVLHNGSVHVLEDRFGHLNEVADGPLTPFKEATLAAYARAAYYRIVRTSEVWAPGSKARAGASE